MQGARVIRYEEVSVSAKCSQFGKARYANQIQSAGAAEVSQVLAKFLIRLTANHNKLRGALTRDSPRDICKALCWPTPILLTGSRLKEHNGRFSLQREEPIAQALPGSRRWLQLKADTFIGLQISNATIEIHDVEIVDSPVSSNREEVLGPIIFNMTATVCVSGDSQDLTAAQQAAKKRAAAAVSYVHNKIPALTAQAMDQRLVPKKGPSEVVGCFIEDLISLVLIPKQNLVRALNHLSGPRKTLLDQQAKMSIGVALTQPDKQRSGLNDVTHPREIHHKNAHHQVRPKA
jgi:hypothetical protein